MKAIQASPHTSEAIARTFVAGWSGGAMGGNDVPGGGGGGTAHCRPSHHRCTAGLSGSG